MMLRKLFSLGAATATLLGVVAGTAAVAQASPAKVTLTWWTWTTNPEQVIANFEKAYPDITIPIPPSYGSGGTFYAKLTTATGRRDRACVTQVEYDHLPQFIAATRPGQHRPVRVPVQEDFPAWTWDQVSQGSDVYAVPEDIGPMGLMYQPAVLKKYNLPVPTTWAQFASDAVALHKADPSQYLTYFAAQRRRPPGVVVLAGRGVPLRAAVERQLEDQPSTARSSRR